MATNEQNTPNLGEMSPSKYFEILKDRKRTITDKDLIKFYDNAISLLNKYQTTGQIEGMKKLIFLIETVEKEREIVKQGINTFVYYEDVEDYIDNIAKNVVKIIELERYERDIPDEVVEVISQTKHLFTKFYVVFTDYTGRIERQVQKERREKDPILFGTFQDTESKTLLERFYFIADWEDEYCDLTLGRMVEEVKAAKSKDIIRTINTPNDVAELKQQLADLNPQNGTYKIKENRIKHFLKKINLFKKDK